MIEPVGSNQTYDYSKVNTVKPAGTPTESGEKFSLNYEKEGVAYEPTQNTALKGTDAEDTGVRLTLTGQSENTDQMGQHASGSSFTDSIITWLQKAQDVLKAFWSRVWDSPEKAPGEHDVDAQAMETLASDRGQTTDVAQATDTAPATEFEKAKQEAELFLEQHAGKQPMRWSDLLTYYDKHGAIVDVDASNKQRILYGDGKNLKG